MPTSLVDAWRNIILGDHKSWVVFENGTCVTLMQPEADLATQAIRILKEWGPVQVATPSADFSVITLSTQPGWVVTCHHPDVLTYVDPEDVGENPPELVIGMTGRSRRNEDAEELKVLHVEDKRTARE